jgi:hypothetical protein
MFSKTRGIGGSVEGEDLVRKLLHLFLGEEDQAAHQSDRTLEFCRVRGEEWLEVFIGILDGFGLL